jgi:dihydrodipicolinate synthase/N-acetylneuraminate lyase
MQNIRGIIPPIPTFLHEDGNLDEHAQVRTVERLIAAGLDGLLALGTAGEGPVLPDHVRARALSATVSAAAGQLPVVACVSGQTSGTVLVQIEEAARAGASAVLLLPPFYLPLSQRHLYGFVDEVASRSSLPVLLYHIPERTGHGFGLELLHDLAGRPEIVGIKDSGKDLTHHHRLLREVENPDFAVFQGAAPLLLASAVAGCRDSMCPVTALVPEWELEMRAALQRADLAAASTLGGRVDAMAALFSLGDGPMPSLFKTAAYLLGFGPATPHDPFARVPATVQALVADGMRELGLRTVREDRDVAGTTGRTTA